MEKYKSVFISAVAVISMASIAGATGIQVDFDRGVSGQPSFIEAARAMDTASPAAAAVCAKADSGITQAAVIHKLSTQGMMKLREEITDIPGVSSEVIRTAADKRIGVLFDDKNAYLVIPVGKDYYTLQESAAEGLLAFLKEQRAVAIQATQHNKSWVTKCRPVIKIIWKWIKEAWVAYEITEEICELVEVDDTPSGGGTWDPGPGPGAVPPGNPFENRGKGW